MLKLLIVDDEKLDLEGLKRQLDWTKYDISEIYATRDSFQALELIGQYAPDILITDIKMPGMNGLVLAEKAKELVSSIKIVFVSGYDDFAYVKNAIKLNAYEYILKPVDTDELETCIRQVVGDILKDKKEEEEKQELVWAAEDGKLLLRNKLLLDLLFGNAESGKLWDKIHFLNINIKSGCQVVCLVEIDDYMMMQEQYSRNELAEKRNRLQDIITGIPIRDCFMELVRTEEHRNACIISFESCGDNDGNMSAVNEEALTIIREVYQQLGLSISVGIGTFVKQPGDLHKSYNESVQAVYQKLYEGKGKILRFAEYSNVSGTKPRFDKVNSDLSKCLLSLDRPRANQIIDAIFDRFKEEKIENNKIIQDYCINTIGNAQVILNDLKVGLEDIFGDEYIIWDKLMRFETILDIRQWMKNMYGAFIDYLIKREESMTSKIINEVLRYIDEHYQEEISLKEIAKTFFYSPNYLGSLFKQEIGQGFVEYLSEFRIKKAADYIGKGTFKVYEVAAMVGYNDIPTFIKKFKAVFGITPTEYRERVK